MPTIQIDFTFRNETKGAVRFEEQTLSELHEPQIGTLYVRKSALRALGLTASPEKLTVTLSVPEK